MGSSWLHAASRYSSTCEWQMCKCCMDTVASISLLCCAYRCWSVVPVPLIVSVSLSVCTCVFDVRRLQAMALLFLWRGAVWSGTMTTMTSLRCPGMGERWGSSYSNSVCGGCRHWRKWHCVFVLVGCVVYGDLWALPSHSQLSMPHWGCSGV